MRAIRSSKLSENTENEEATMDREVRNIYMYMLNRYVIEYHLSSPGEYGGDFWCKNRIKIMALNGGNKWIQR